MSRKSVKTPLIYALEPRLLFDGDLGADIASAIVYRDGNNGPETPAETEAEAPAVAPENQRENITFEFHSARSAIVFIDGALEDTQTLIDAVPASAEVHILNGDSDGFEQISEILEHHDRVDEIHIFGHGAAGEARLGTASLSLETLTTHSDTLAVLKNSLTEDGDILLYGCDIAAGEDGEAFIEELAELTAADIAASDDITGAGGDWELEVNIGLIEANEIEAWDYQYALTPDGVTDMNAGPNTTVIDKSSISNLNVSAQPDNTSGSSRGFYDTTGNNRFVIALEKSNITTTDTLYFDFGVSVGTNGSYNVSSSQPVASYLVALNNNIGRRDSVGSDANTAAITFEHDVLGYYVEKHNTLGSGQMVQYSTPGGFVAYQAGDSRVNQIDNSYFANSNWIYPDYNSGSYNKRDTEGYFNTTNDSHEGNKDYVWFTNNGQTLNMAADNGNTSGTGDFIRVITKWTAPNSAPTVTSATDVSGSVTELADGHANENTATLTDTGSFNIADSNNDSVTTSSSFSSTTHSSNSAFGVLTATVANNTTDGTGQISWSYAVDDSALDALEAGESYTETWTITVSDGTASTTQNVTITLNGAADPLVVARDDFASVTEGEAVTADTLSGVLHTTNTASQDTGDNLIIQSFRTGSVEGSGNQQSPGADLPGSYGILNIGLNGNYTYTANSDISGLDVGEAVYDFYNYTATDSAGNTDTAVLQITINGGNEGPTISTAAVDPSVNEAVDASNQALSGSGTIVFADDTDSSLTITAQTSSTVSASSGVTLSNTLQNALAAAIVVSDNGDNTASWVLNADGLDLDFLAAGDSITIENVVTATDDQGESVTDTITVTINGTNDAPSGANNTVTTIEDNNHVFQASEFGFNDPDTGDALSRITVENLPTDGVLRFTNDGTTWENVSAGGNFTKAMIDAGWLRFEPASNENGSPYASFNFKVHDGDEASAYVAIMTINVAAWADAPTANDDTISATSGTVATGTVLANDSDPDGTTPTVSAIETGSSVGSGTSGTIGSALPGTYGSLTLNEDGTYTYSVDADHADVLALGAGDDPLTETFTYTITDGTAFGGTDTATISVNVYGINDAPTVTAETIVNGTVTEFPNGDPNEDTGTHTITGSFDIADTDSSSFTLSYETSVQWASEISTHNSTQPVGTFTLSDQTVDGTGSIEWTYSIADYLIADKVTANGEVSYLSLDSGENFAETFTITIDDGDGETVTQDVVITVNGANDFDAQDDFAVVAEGGSISVGNDAGQSVGNPITDASSAFDAAFGGDGDVAVEALAFNNDGSKLYLLENNSGRIQQHTLSTQFDVSTASAEYTMYDGVNWSRDLVFNADGTKAFTINPSTDIVYEYTLTTPFDIGTMELAFQKAVSDGQGTNVRPKALDFSSDGTKLFYIDQEGQQIIQENLGTAYDTSTATLAAILDISEVQGNGAWGEGFVISPDGRKMFATSEGNRIYEWILHTPNDITTATFIHDRDLSSFGYNLRGLAFSNDGSKLFFANKSSGTTEDVVTFNTSVPFSTFYDEPSHSGDVINTNRDETRDTGGNLDVASFRTGATKGAGTPGTLGTPLPGAYGSLTMDANGSYTYQANNDISNWDAGKVGYDQFNYTINQGDPADGAAHAVLTIKVVAQDDAPTVSQAAVDQTIAELDDASSQDLSQSGTIAFADDLDSYLTITGAASATVTAGIGDNFFGTATLPTIPSALQAALEGAFSITDNNDNTASWSLDVAGLDLDFLKYDQTIILDYVVTATDDGGQTVTDTITVTLTGTDDKPTSVNVVRDINKNGTYTFVASDFAFSDLDGGVFDTLEINGTSTGTLSDDGTPVSENESIFLPVDYLSDPDYSLTYTPAPDEVGQNYVSLTFTVYSDQYEEDGLEGTGSDASQEYTFTFNVNNSAPVAADITTTVFEDSTITSGGSRVDLIGPTNDIYDPQYNGDGGYQVGYETVMPVDLVFSPDGNTLFVLAHSDMQGNVDRRVITYDLDQPWDVSAWTFRNEFDLPASGTNGGMAFNNDGTKMYVSKHTHNGEGALYSFNLSTAYDPSTATHDSGADIAIPDTSGETRYLEPNDGRFDLDFSHDGLSMFVLELLSPSANTGEYESRLLKYSLGTAWDISTADMDNPTVYSFFDNINSTRESGFTFGGNGTKLFVIHNGNNTGGSGIREYSLATPYDISNMTEVRETSLDDEWISKTFYNIELSADNTKLFLSGHGHNNGGYSTGAYIYEFDLYDTPPALSNDTDADGDTLTLTHIGSDAIASGTTYQDGTTVNGQYGVLTIGADGSYRYVSDNRSEDPLDAGETVTDTFTYTASDGTATDTANLVFTVIGVNDPPTANNNTVTINENATKTFVASDFNFADVDGDDSLDHITIATLPATGTLTLSGSAVEAGDNIAANQIENLVYTPVADENGDPYTSFTFTVNDGTADSASSYTMTIDVTPVNDAPTAADNTVTTNEGEAHTFAASEFNFADVDGNSLDHVKIVAKPAGGELRVNNIVVVDGTHIAAADIGNLVFYPLANTNGDPYTSFTFQVNDGAAYSASTYTMTVVVTPVNDAPTAADDTINATSGTDEIGDVLANDSDPDGTTPIVSAIETGSTPGSGTPGTVGSPLTGTYGSLTLHADGTYTYVVDANNADVLALGAGDAPLTETFTYTITDGSHTDTATITVNVSGVNDAPTVDTPAVDPDFNEDVDASAQDLVASGTIIFEDGDNTELSITGATSATVTASNGVTLYADLRQALEAAFSITTDGNTATWTLNVQDLDLDFLDVGDSITLEYDVTAEDDVGETVTDTITVTINGTNDVPRFADRKTQSTNGVGSNVVVELPLTISELSDGHEYENNGTLLSGFWEGVWDDGSQLEMSVEFLSTTHSSGEPVVTNYQISNPEHRIIYQKGGGYYSILAGANDSDLDYLAAGESYTDTFRISAGDIHGATATQDFQIIVNGANDAPVLQVERETISETTNNIANDTGTTVTTSVSEFFGRDGALSTINEIISTTEESGGTESQSIVDTVKAAHIAALTDGNASSSETYENGNYPYAQHPDAQFHTYSTTEHNVNFDLDGTYANGSVVVWNRSSGFASSRDRINGTTVELFHSGNSVWTSAALNRTQEDSDAKITVTPPSNIQFDQVRLNFPANSQNLREVQIFGAEVTASGDAGASQTATVAENTTAVLDFTGTDVDTSDTLAYSISGTDADDFTIDINTGALTFTSAPDYEAPTDDGTDNVYNLTVTVSDGIATDSTDVTVTVTDADEPLTANDDTINATSGTDEIGDVLANDSDPDGTTPIVSAIETGSTPGSGTPGTVGSPLTGTYGSLTLHADGTYTYVVDANNADVLALGAGDAPLTETFTYTITDGSHTDTATITVNVSGVNDAPTLTGNFGFSSSSENEISIGELLDQHSGSWGAENDYTHTKNMHLNFADADGDALTVTKAFESYTVSPNVYPFDAYARHSSAPYGTLTATIEETTSNDGGEWRVNLTYTVEDSVLDILAADEVVSEIYTITVADGAASYSTQVEVNLVGEIDIYVEDDFATVNEGASISVNAGETPELADAKFTSANSPLNIDTFYDGYVHSNSTLIPLTVEGVTFNNDGTKMYLTDMSGNLSHGSVELVHNQYTLSTPFDISTATPDNKYLGANRSSSQISGTLVFNNDGTKAFNLHRIGANYYQNIVEYSLETPYDIDTATEVKGTEFFSPKDFAFNHDGTKMIYLAQGWHSQGFHPHHSRIIQYDLSTPYDLDTATNYLDTHGDNGDVLIVEEADPGNPYSSIEFSPDGRKLFLSTMPVNGDETYVLHEWFLHTPFDITTASKIGSVEYSSLVRSHGLEFNNDGTKVFIPTRDNAEIVDVHEYDAQVPFSQFYQVGGHSGDAVNNDRGTSNQIISVRKGSIKGSGDEGTLGQSLSGDYGALTLHANGSYTYVANSDIDGLDENEVVYDQFNYTVEDASGDSNIGVITITINGINSNTPPTIETAAVDPSISEAVDASSQDLLASGTITFADDSDTDLAISGAASTLVTTGAGVSIPSIAMQIALEGAISVTDNGDNTATWQLDASGLDLDFLDEGETITLEYAVTAEDDDDETVTDNVTVTITGTNDAPIAIDDTGNVEVGTEFSGNVLTSSMGGEDVELDAGDSFQVDRLTGFGTAQVISNTPGSSATAVGTYGTITLGEDGSVTYNADQAAAIALASGQPSVSETFNYRISDADGETGTGTITFTISGVNDAPAVSDDNGTPDDVSDDIPNAATVSTVEDTPHTFSGNDFNFTDIDTDDTLASVTITSLPDKGTLTLNGTEVTLDTPIAVADLGNLVYTPVDDESGAGYTSFTYTVSDGALDSPAATMTINVTPDNDAPAVSDDNGTPDDVSDDIPNAATISTVEDTPHTFGVDDFNFTDIDTDDTLASVTITSLPDKGTLTLNGTEVTLDTPIAVADLGNLVYTPVDDESGAGYTSFTYTVSDGALDSPAATMTINVTPDNDAPAVSDDNGTPDDVSDDIPNAATVSTVEDTPHTFSGNDFNFTDIDTDDTLASVTITSLPDKGTLTLNGTEVTLDTPIAVADLGNLVYTPVDDESGAGYTSFTYTVSDGALDSPAATMTINVTPDNDAPIAADDTSNILVGSEYIGNVLSAQMGGEDTDPDGVDTLTVSALGDTPIEDNLGASASVVGTYGTLVLGRDGSLTYNADQPAAAALSYGDDAVTDTFTYTVSDGNGGSDTATVTFSVTAPNPGNTPPTSEDNTLYINEDASLTFARDQFSFSDPDGDILRQITIVSVPDNGSLILGGRTINAGDTITTGQIGALSYSPATNENGSDYASFTFRVNDGEVDSVDTYTMNIDILPVNDAPTASDNSVTIDEDATKAFTAAEFGFADIDDGDSLHHITIATLPTTGTLTLSGAAVNAGDNIAAADIENLVYTPVADANGAPYADFTFTVNDGAEDSAETYTMTVNVTPLNDAPKVIDNNGTPDDASDDVDSVASISTVEDVDRSIGVNDLNFTDIDRGNSFASVTITTLPSAGTLLVDGVALTNDNLATLGANITAAQLANDELVFRPEPGNSGDNYADFTFTVSDGQASSTTATMTVDVTPENDAPVVAAITDSKTEDDTAFNTDLLLGQSDPDGDSLSIASPIINAEDNNGNTLTLPEGAASVSGNELRIDPTLFNGLDDGESAVITVTYDVSDGALSEQNTATITITGVNDAPTITPLTNANSKDDPNYRFDLLQGAEDLDGDTVSISGTPEIVFTDKDGNEVPLPAGAATLIDNEVEISPTIFSTLDVGEDVVITVNYDITDGDETVSNSATITISGDNTPPQIIDDNGTIDTSDDIEGVASIRIDEDTPHDFSSDDFNFADENEGDTLTQLTILSLPEKGTLLLGGNPVSAGDAIEASQIVSLTYAPAENDHGDDYASFTYSVNDGTDDSPIGIMAVHVNAVNDLPTSADAHLPLNGQDEVPLSADNFAFADADGGGLDKVIIVTAPSEGILFLNNQPVQDGDEIRANQLDRLSYKPGDDASGENYDAFTFKVNDGEADSANSYTMSIGVNAPPVATPSSVSVTEGRPADGTLDATDPDDADLTYRITRQPEHGTLRLIDGGPDYIYTPDDHYYGSDSFEFEASDGSQTSEEAEVSLTIAPVNNAPIERLTVGPQVIMVDGKVKPIKLRDFFGDVDAFDPDKPRFQNNVANLYEKGTYPNSAKFDDIPPEGDLTFTVESELPPGLTFNGESISGRPTEPGVYDIVMKATDGLSLSALSSFKMFVGMPITDVTIDPPKQGPEPRDDSKPEETAPDLNDHDLPKVLKVNPKRDGSVPTRTEMTAEIISDDNPVSDMGANAGLSDDGWMDTKVSSEQDVSGNIRVVDLQVKGDEFAVQIADEAVDRAENFKGEMADGSNLPDWVNVDPDTGLTTATPPEGAKPIEMRIIAADSSGNERAIDLVLNPEAVFEVEQDEKPTREERREARQERREARQAERQARIEAREERRAERTEKRAFREFSRNNSEVSVLSDGRVLFADGLTAAGEGAMKLMRMVTSPEAVTIEIADEMRGDTTRYEVRQKDGSDVPDWVQVDAATGELVIEATENLGMLELTLIAVDGNNQRSIELEINLDEMNEEGEATEEDLEATDEIEAGNAATDSEPVSSFTPLDDQIDAALTNNNYGQDLQTAMQTRV